MIVLSGGIGWVSVSPESVCLMTRRWSPLPEAAIEIPTSTSVCLLTIKTLNCFDINKENKGVFFSI